MFQFETTTQSAIQSTNQYTIVCNWSTRSLLLAVNPLIELWCWTLSFFFPINPWSLNRLLALVEIEYSQPFESKQSHRVANIIARELTVSVSPIYLNCFCFHRFTHTPFTIRPVPIVLGSFWATFGTFEQFFALLRYFWARYRFRARKSWQFH